MSTLLGWWKGENNTVDSVNGNDAVWGYSSDLSYNDAGPAYYDGYSGRCFNLFMGNDDDDNLLRIPYNTLYNFDSADKVEIEFYFYDNGDIWYTDRFLFRKVASGNYTTNYDKWLYGLKIDGFSDRDITLHVNPDDRQMGARQVYSQAFNYDEWVKVNIKYENSVWQLFINDVLLTPAATISEPIVSGVTGDYVIGAVTPFLLMDEIKILNNNDHIVIPPIEDNNIVQSLLESNEVAQLYLQYGGDTKLTISSEAMQVISFDGFEAELIFINDDIEILQGSK